RLCNRQRGDLADDPTPDFQARLNRPSPLLYGQPLGRPAEGRSQCVELPLPPIFLVIFESVEQISQPPEIVPEPPQCSRHFPPADCSRSVSEKHRRGRGGGRRQTP